MPLTGEGKREHNRQHYRSVVKPQRHAARAERQTAALKVRPREARVIESIVSGKSVSQALREEGFNQGSLRARLRPGGDLADALRRALERKGLTLDKIIGKVAEKLDAQRPVTVAGEATMTDDNDAQLRAADLGCRLHERAGTIPSVTPVGAGGLSLTLVEVHYGTTSGGQDGKAKAIVSASC